MTCRCIDQARTCHRWNLSVRPFVLIRKDTTPTTRGLWSSSIHAVSWEFICNLGFELSLLRSRRQWRWTAAVSAPRSPITSRFITTDAFFSQQLYIACRFFTISQVATDLVGLNMTNQFNCKARFSHALLPILAHPLFSQVWLTFSLVCVWPLRSPLPSW